LCEDRLVEVCTLQAEAAESRFGGVGVAEIVGVKLSVGGGASVSQVCSREPEAAEIRFGEVGVAEIVAVKWSAGCVPQVSQVCSGEHRMQVRVAKPPFVPSIS